MQDGCMRGGRRMVSGNRIERESGERKNFADIRLRTTALATVGEEDRTPP